MIADVQVQVSEAPQLELELGESEVLLAELRIQARKLLQPLQTHTSTSNSKLNQFQSYASLDDEHWR